MGTIKSVLSRKSHVTSPFQAFGRAVLNRVDMRRRLGERLWTNTPTCKRGQGGEGWRTENVKSDCVFYQGGQCTRQSMVALA